METNLNMLFQELIGNFAHLLSVHNISKEEFIQRVITTYSVDNRKTALFVASCKTSVFETIKLSNNKNQILFNHE